MQQNVDTTCQRIGGEIVCYTPMYTVECSYEDEDRQRECLQKHGVPEKYWDL
jgi:hypothetical protein